MLERRRSRCDERDRLFWWSAILDLRRRHPCSHPELQTGLPQVPLGAPSVGIKVGRTGLSKSESWISCFTYRAAAACPWTRSWLARSRFGARAHYEANRTVSELPYQLWSNGFRDDLAGCESATRNGPRELEYLRCVGEPAGISIGKTLSR
jgi:hypothetical protein